MSYLLDTNVLSELRKSERNAAGAVRTWVASKLPIELHLSSITVLEIELGIRRLERRDTAQAARIRVWLEQEVLDIFSGRILSVDVAVARRAATLHVPDPRPERDALIAATAVEHDLTLVTRNVVDFEPMGLQMLNPWIAH